MLRSTGSKSALPVAMEVAKGALLWFPGSLPQVIFRKFELEYYCDMRIDVIPLPIVNVISTHVNREDRHFRCSQSAFYEHRVMVVSWCFLRCSR